MATLAVNGIRMAYDDCGSGDHVLVLIHGHPFDRSMWGGQSRAAVRAGWRVIAPDLRGYGETTVVPGKTTLEDFARDVAALLDHLGVRSAIFAGLSMGGQIVMEIARHHPARVRGIVLAATFPRAETEQGKRERYATAEQLAREGMDRYAGELLAKMLAPRNAASLPETARYVIGMMRRTDPDGAAAALRGRAERPGYEDVLARLDAPALIVVGDEDAYTTRTDADQMHGFLGRSELVWMRGVGHLPNLEREADFNAALVRFLERVAG